MGPNLQKKKKKKKNFKWEESLDMSRGFRPWAAHPIKNNSGTLGVNRV